jgi:hypothetical protein
VLRPNEPNILSVRFEQNNRVVEQFQPSSCLSNRSLAGNDVLAWGCGGKFSNSTDSSGEIMPNSCPPGEPGTHSESSPKCPDCFVQVCALTEVIG